MAKATNGEERMWCSHCGVNTPIRREGNSGFVKSCNWCGKVLADETGTAEEYNQLFLQHQALQDFVSVSDTRTRRTLLRSMIKNKNKTKTKNKNKNKN